MKELVEFIARELVDHPEDVEVSARKSGTNVYVDVTAAPEDVGRLIGRHGRTAQAIRAVTKVAAARQGLRVVIDID